MFLIDEDKFNKNKKYNNNNNKNRQKKFYRNQAPQIIYTQEYPMPTSNFQGYNEPNFRDRGPQRQFFQPRPYRTNWNRRRPRPQPPVRRTYDGYGKTFFNNNRNF